MFWTTRPITVKSIKNQNKDLVDKVCLIVVCSIKLERFAWGWLWHICWCERLAWGWCLCTPKPTSKGSRNVRCLWRSFLQAFYLTFVKQLTHELMSLARKFNFTNTFCLYQVFLFFPPFFSLPPKKDLNHPCVSYGGLVTGSVCASAYMLSAWSTIGGIWYERNWKWRSDVKSHFCDWQKPDWMNGCTFTLMKNGSSVKFSSGGLLLLPQKRNGKKTIKPLIWRTWNQKCRLKSHNATKSTTKQTCFHCLLKVRCLLHWSFLLLGCSNWKRPTTKWPQVILYC